MNRWGFRDTFGDREMAAAVYLQQCGIPAGLCAFVHWVLGDDMEWVPSFTGHSNLLQRKPSPSRKTTEVYPGWMFSYETSNERGAK